MKIQQLGVYTRNLEKQLRFYRDMLGFEVLQQNEQSFDLVAGYSILRFVLDKDATPYHVAFHIPAFQEKKALEWLESRSEILKLGEDKIVDFSNWNAKSVYFYDEDKNILEFIARKDFPKTQTSQFSVESILGISEIGMATDDIKEKYDVLSQQCGLDVFDGDFEKFCAIGEPWGLLITIDKNKKDWFPVDDIAYASAFVLNFEHKERSFQLEFKKDQLQILNLT